jgi:hypothetical protein
MYSMLELVDWQSASRLPVSDSQSPRLDAALRRLATLSFDIKTLRLLTISSSLLLLTSLICPVACPPLFLFPSFERLTDVH